jgi:hypothetical protein
MHDKEWTKEAEREQHHQETERGAVRTAAADIVEDPCRAHLRKCSFI